MPLMEFENLNINEAEEVLKRKNIKEKNSLILFPLKVENLILIAMLDTGATANFLPNRLKESFQKEIKSSSTKLRMRINSYNSSDMQNITRTYLHVAKDNTSSELEVLFLENDFMDDSYDIILGVNSLRALNIQIVGLPLGLSVFGKKIQPDGFLKEVSSIATNEESLSKSLCSITSESNLLEFLCRKFNLRDENHPSKIFKNLMKKHDNQNFIPDHENDSEEDVLEEEINSNEFETMLEKHDALLEESQENKEFKESSKHSAVNAPTKSLPDQETVDFNNEERNAFIEKLKAHIEKNLDTIKDPCNKSYAYIDLKLKEENTYFWIPQYGIPLLYHEKVDQQIQKWMNEKVVDVASEKCKFNLPIWVVPKFEISGEVSNSVRVCLDARHLNKRLDPSVLDEFKLPTTTGIYNQILQADANVIFELDLYSGYNQFPLSDKAKEFLSFTWRGKHLSFQRAPFGVQFLSSHFQRAMMRILSKHLKYCAIYIDNIIVFSANEIEHELHLKAILEDLTEAAVTINVEKSKFFHRKIKTLGFTLDLSLKAIHVAQDKLKKVKNLSKNIFDCKSLNRYLGFMNYFRSLIINYSELTHQLDKLRKVKNKELFQKNFSKLGDDVENLNNALLNTKTLLHFPDENFPIYIASDASYSGFGNVAFQIINGEKR
jgi:hypothetical protein